MTTTLLENTDRQMMSLESKSAEDFVGELLEYALSMSASDLHFHAGEISTDVSIRYLGTLQRVGTLAPKDAARVLTHIKVVAGMDATRVPVPIDGRCVRRFEDGTVVDLRINTIPTLHGEDMTIRILERNSTLLDLSNLGFHPKNLYHLTGLLKKSSGLILITGPTGTGKTTTLYSCLKMLNDGTRKINTIEDPVEYALPDIHQAQVNPKRGLDFPDLLRGVLRQAPDVIMVGEVRDATTAETVVRAANSGQLVFATLHAPTASGAIESMLAHGVRPHFLASSLIGVLSQRLVRVLCPHCKQSHDISNAPHTFHDVKRWLRPNEGKVVFTPGDGCSHCNGRAFVGRNAAIEVLRVTPSVRKLVRENAPASAIQAMGIEQGMIDLRRAVLLKVAQGLCTGEEVVRATPPEQLVAEELMREEHEEHVG